jgi:Caspase domain
VRALVLTCVFLLAGVSHAGTDRFALLVANHDGGSDLPRLRYAARDLSRMSDVLTDLGQFSRSDILSVVDGDAATVMGTLDEVERRVQESKRRGNEVVLVFYYSGHAQNGVLRLGDTLLEMGLVKRQLEESTADVRLAFVDSCGAGAMTREKGGQLAPPFVVAVDEGLSAKGQVIITSSSADEVSQESDDIQGSFFTHYLSTGLRGEADRDKDGRVTLDEAYGYAYGRTVAATSQTRAGAQHPTYAYDLHGAGDVVITEPGGADVVLAFPAELVGRYFVVDLERQVFVAEVEKDRGQASSVALPKGQYAIKKRMDSHLLISRVEARTKGVFVVDERQMEQVAFADDYAKGTPILEDELKWRDTRWSVSLGLGAHAVLDTVDNGNLFPATPLIVIEARAHNLIRPHLLTSLDLDLGSVQSERVIDGGQLGTLRFPVQHTVIQGGAALLWEERFFDDALLLAGGGRVAGLFFLAQFAPDAPVQRQTYMSFSPGLVGLVGFSPFGWAHLEIMARAHYLPYNVDELRSLAVVEGIASVWVDF